MGRETSTLSPVLREACDSGTLNIMTKHQAANCIDAHISIIAHITAPELRKLLGDMDCSNGFANRFLWVWASRSKLLPYGGNLSLEALRPIASRLCEAAAWSTGILQICFDAEARDLWAKVYGELSEAGDGLLGSITSRNEAQAVRLATIFAVLDGSSVIQVQHLKAALAIVDYSTRTVSHIFGKQVGDNTAEAVLCRLKQAGSAGLTRSELSDAFGRNKKASDIGRALQTLEQRSIAYMREEQTSGRIAQRWFFRNQETTTGSTGIGLQ